MELFLNFLTFECSLRCLTSLTQLTLPNAPAIQNYYTAEHISLSCPSKWQKEQQSPKAGLVPDFCSWFCEPANAQEQTCTTRICCFVGEGAQWGWCFNSGDAELISACMTASAPALASDGRVLIFTRSWDGYIQDSWPELTKAIFNTMCHHAQYVSGGEEGL